MTTDKKNITIATPLLAPQIGGSAVYAQLLEEQWKKDGHRVRTVSFGALLRFPTGIRHFLYSIKLLPAIVSADIVYTLDTFSVALPTVLFCRIFRKKVVVRVAGDFLWESYVNRTKEKILLSEFYTKEREFSFKENAIFDLTKFIFQYVDVIVFSTEWQKNIFKKPYEIDVKKVYIIENVYESGTKRNIVPKNKVILSPSRDIFLKNKESLQGAFEVIHERFFDAVLDTQISSHDELLKRIKDAYMVVVPSLSEVSPNMVLDAVSYGVPVVVTADCGIRSVLGDCVVWVDPKDRFDIARGIELLMDARTYSEYMARMSKFAYSNTGADVARKFLDI